MTLRTRIYSGFALLLLTFVAVGAVVVITQRGRLIDQLDDRLGSVAPLNRGAPRQAGGGQAPPVGGAAQDSPISDLYIATLVPDGSVEVLVQGQLLTTTPVIDPDLVSTVGERRFVTLESADGSTDFRALIERTDTPESAVAIAIPMNDVNDSIRQLTLTLGLLGAFAAALLGVLAAWIARLGLRPISEMTVAATAIAAGDRETRAPELDPRTEAGQLATAFNEMLDQRDDAEARVLQFVSDASHELRTPLTSVIGYLDLYSQGGFREPGQLDDAVERIQSEAGRMKTMVENLLALARFDGEQPLSRSTFDLAALVGDVVADSQAADPNRHITADVEDGLQPVSLDRDKAQQLLIGLVANALTHAPDADVVVRGRRDGGTVELIVADDGPGLSQEQADRVFERFYRGDPARTRSSGGSGLGLAIAKSIAVAHGGSIELETSPGAGCEFIVRLPNAGAHTAPGQLIR